MLDARACPDCGAPLPARSPEGLCPRCLLGAGTADETPVDATGSFGGPGRVLATLAATVGPVPRILLRDTDGGPEPPIVRPAVEAGDGASLRYRIDGEIARGGMGAVLRGRDPDLGRDVAIKVLRDDLLENPDMVRRFVEEAQIGGQLQHPGVVPIYELGAFADRRPFFSMKLVKGHTLAALLDGRTDPKSELPRLLNIVEAIAQTVAYAHARGVIHRDVKPSNVMVGSFGEVQVMDWGLAKVLPRGGVVDDASAGLPPPNETVIATARSGSGDSDLSRAGSVLGTPSYMAPEQARGEIDRVDERADVFALGSILCEVLTGDPAFVGRSSGEIQRKAALGDTADALARLDTCGADAELVALARDCLAREPEDRPREAGAVSRRPTGYLAGVQERLRSAERDRAVAEARAVEDRRRRRLQVVLAASVLALVGLGGAGGLVLARQRADRIAATTRVVDDALGRAADLGGRARSVAAGDLPGWDEALAQVKRAEDALAQGAADDALQGRVAAVREQLDRGRAQAVEAARRQEAERVLLADLEVARIAPAESDGPGGLDAAFVAAFRKAGLDVGATDPVEAGRWLAARPAVLELVGAVDDWATWRITYGGRGTDWRRLIAVARAADPDPWRDAIRARVGDRSPAAAATLRRLADDDAALDAQPAASLILLARMLRNPHNDHERATRVLGRATLRHPTDFWVHYCLAIFHGDDYGPFAAMFPRPEESILHLTAAIALRPTCRLARGRLALALRVAGKPEESRAVLRESLRLWPDAPGSAGVRWELLTAEGKADEALAAAREAIRREPGDAGHHFHLGQTLLTEGKPDEAALAFREAARLDPKDAVCRNNVGLALLKMGKPEEALVEFRKAQQIAPTFTWIQANIASAERAASVGPRFPALLKGDAQPKDNAERLAVAEMCYDARHFVPAVRFYAEAAGIDPKLVDDRESQYLYGAACTAARAPARQGVHQPQPHEPARAKLRGQALDWLRIELDAWSRHLGSGRPGARGMTVQGVAHWRLDPDLATVRGEALARLPEPERKGWQALWADVDALLKKAQAARP